MPTTICPRCQTPIAPKTAYLRIYSTNEEGREDFIRIHLQCPVPAEESPNLAAQGGGPVAMQGGGGSAPVPRMMQAAAAVGAVVAARRARRARR